MTETAGVEVIHTEVQSREKIDPAYYIGRGKCEQLKGFVEELGVDLVIFDDDLSPAQVRNLERILGGRIIDRTGIILDIFAQRARSAEAQIQVELAQLEYLLPRLTRQWGHLSRQTGGGVFLRGPGETQLETDRRLVREKISQLKKKLERIERNRSTRRKKRSDIPTAALVGYTNAGKSTLLNALTSADAFVEDKLFATLDPLVRGFEDSLGRKMLLTDTVGFIRKLPHHLVASFKSTMEEAAHADLVVHVVDVSHPFYMEQMEWVMQLLEEIGAGGVPAMTVFNKVDLVQRDSILSLAKSRCPDGVFISALRKIGFEKLIDEISERLYVPPLAGEIRMEPELSAEWGRRFGEVKIVSSEFTEGMVKIRFLASPKLKDTLFEFAGSGNISFEERV